MWFCRTLPAKPIPPALDALPTTAWKVGGLPLHNQRLGPEGGSPSLRRDVVGVAGAVVWLVWLAWLVWLGASGCAPVATRSSTISVLPTAMAMCSGV